MDLFIFLFEVEKFPGFEWISSLSLSPNHKVLCFILCNLICGDLFTDVVLYIFPKFSPLRSNENPSCR